MENKKPTLKSVNKKKFFTVTEAEGEQIKRLVNSVRLAESQTQSAQNTERAVRSALNEILILHCIKQDVDPDQYELDPTGMKFTRKKE